MITNDKGYFQIIEVKGRESHLMDDLEYTKNALLIEHSLGPLIEAMQDDLDGKRKKMGK